VFRVRLGPYDSPDAAYADASAHPGLLPADAFIDSVLIDPATGSKAKRSTPNNATSAPRTTPERGAAKAGSTPDGEWKEFDVVRQPLSGYAVKVSSLRKSGHRPHRGEETAGKGYPSFITRATVAGVPW
jgi:hypothetical protein